MRPVIPIPDAWRQRETFKRKEPKLGRNDICHCGSQKKYKNCCWSIDNKEKK